MKSQNTFFLFITVLLAGLFCFALYSFRINGIVFVLAAMAFMVALPLSFRHPTVLLGLTIASIGLCPFFLRARVMPGLPMIYADDVFVLFGIIYMFLAYGPFGRKQIRLGSMTLFILFILFAISAFVPFVTEPAAKTAFRNFTETFIFGFILYIIFYNEVDAKNINTLMRWVAATTLILAVIVCIEVIIQNNPLTRMAQKIMEDFVYLSPENYKFLDSYYRPYAIFFHPSEAGTFLAMGFPFVFYSVRNNRPFIKYAAMALAIVGVILNYTRGVWVALALAMLVCNFKHLKRILPAALALVILLLGLSYLTMGNTPFFRRIFDPTNFYNRLYYWKVGLNMFMTYFPFGIGHMNFKDRYLDFVDTVAAPSGLDVKQIFVADNIFLTTLVEHGFLGFLTQMVLFGAAIWLTARLGASFRKRGDLDNALRLNTLLQALVVYLLAGCFADVQLFAKVTKFFFITTGMALAMGKFAGNERPVLQERAPARPLKLGEPLRLDKE